MARQYSPKGFLRRAPNKLLKRSLAAHDLATDIPWERLGETEIDPIFKAVDGAPESIRSQIDTDFRAIEALADEGGTGILIEEGRDPRHRVELAENLGQMDGHLAKAFWVFMQHPSVFEVASRFRGACLGITRRKVDGRVALERGIDERVAGLYRL